MAILTVRVGTFRDYGVAETTEWLFSWSFLRIFAHFGNNHRQHCTANELIKLASCLVRLSVL